MIWPPVKAWTSKSLICGKAHFVAINYGGELLNRWVILMSVIDSNVVVKVSWLQLINSSNWVCGWSEINYPSTSEIANKISEIKTINCSDISADSGLTIPITKNTIRPWF